MCWILYIFIGARKNENRIIVLLVLLHEISVGDFIPARLLLVWYLFYSVCWVPSEFFLFCPPERSCEVYFSILAGVHFMHTVVEKKQK